ncbi:MAG: SRPBCC domain-containing protein [Acidobacteriota bacterium]
MISEEKLTIEPSAPSPGTVVVSVHVSAPVERVWQSLTEPVIVSCWFGNLSDELVPGGTARLDFGDGDFFDLESIRLAAPGLLQYRWRFLGIGPQDTVTWQLEPTREGCLATVTDGEVGRTHEAAMMLRAGWLDFTSRLVRFHSTGEPTRYDWRRGLDVSLEIQSTAHETWETLSAPEGQTRWLPFNSMLQSGSRAEISDEEEPRLFSLYNVTWQTPYCVKFQMSCDDWTNPTNCQIDLTPRQAGLLLNVSHNGWEDISPDQVEQLRQRKRFCALWIAALKRARQRVAPEGIV